MALLHDPRQAPVCKIDGVLHTALALEVEGDRRAAHGHMLVAQGSQAVGVVLLRILGIAHADEGRLQQADDGRENLLTWQARQFQVLLHAFADLRQHRAEEHHVFVLGLVAHLAPPRMVAALLAAARIAPCGLEMPVSDGTYPYGLPGRRNYQRADAPQRLLIAHGLAVRTGVVEALATPAATNSRLCI